MIAYVLIALGAVMRVLSHQSGFAFFPPNFAPIAGMALFAGAHLTGKQAVAIPMLAMLLSDIVIGFYEPEIMLAVYGCFLLTMLLGRWLRHRVTVPKVAGAAIVSSALFFLITNFAVWAAPGSSYSNDLAGLSLSYVMGLPFFRYTLAGDLFFTGAFFVAYAAAQALLKRPAVAPARFV